MEETARVEHQGGPVAVKPRSLQQRRLIQQAAEPTPIVLSGIFGSRANHQEATLCVSTAPEPRASSLLFQVSDGCLP